MWYYIFTEGKPYCGILFYKEDNIVKKVLSILLVIALTATLFAGCGEEPSASVDPGKSPAASESVNPTTPTPETPPPPTKADWRSDFVEGGELAGIIIYDDVNYLSSWDGATIATLAEVGLKIDAKIAPVNSEVLSINKYDGLLTKEGRDSYVSNLTNIFTDSATMPDFLPALYASNVGTDVAFKQLGPTFLVDLNPFLEEGGALTPYIDWVWTEKMGNTEYFQNAKVALETPNGELYALPRAEFMVEKAALIFNTSALEDLGLEFPETWEDVEEALAAYKAANPDNYGFIHNMEVPTIDSILTPIANAYGLDFDASFAWKEQNGAPLFSYIDDAYLKVLQTAKKFAENGWVLTDPDMEGAVIAGWDCSNNVDNILKGKIKDERWSLASGELMMYGDAWHRYHLGVGDEGYWTDHGIAVDGYKAAISGGSAFDYCYLAISRKSVTADTEEGYETVLRIMNYMTKFCSVEGYMQKCFGKQGIPFADSWAESGNFVWVKHDNGQEYIRFSDGNDRFDMRSEDTTLPMWKAGKPFFETLSPLYTWLFQVCNGFKTGDHQWRSQYNFGKEWNKDMTAEELDVTMDEWLAGEQYTTEIVENEDGTQSEVQVRVKNWSYYIDENHSPYVQDGHVFPYPATENTRLWAWGGRSGGIDFFADVSAFPMQYTIYSFNESQTQQYPIMKELVADVKANGNLIYDAFLPAANEVLSGKEASMMQIKIDNLTKIAKNFTVDYLSGAKGDSDWDAYVKSLNDAGYQDVYDFYAANVWFWQTAK